MPEVEFFSEAVDGVEYLNVGFKFEYDGVTKRCVLGAFEGEGPDQQAMIIIKGLVEQAALYMQEEYSKPVELVAGESIWTP